MDTYVVIFGKVSGVERGLGTGRSQKLAKEEAAKIASVNMGWNVLT